MHVAIHAQSPSTPAQGTHPRLVRDPRHHAHGASCSAPVRAVARLSLLLAVPVARAHEGDGHAPSLADAWSLSPWVLLPLAAWALAYAVGVARLWRRAGIGGGVRVAEASGFALGIATLLLAAVWPLDALGEWSLGAHMAQHMLLLAVVPPMLLAGRPRSVLAHALPAAWAQGVHRGLGSGVRHAGGALAAACVAHAGVMIGWHLPAATAAALANDAVHWAMHLSFLGAGLWFWTALWRRLREPDVGAGAGLVAVVAVMMPMGLMGALLTFSPRVLYPVYLERAPQLGLDPLVDQQLAGIVMWVPGAVPYLVGGLWLLSRSFARAGQRDTASGSTTDPAVPR